MKKICLCLVLLCTGAGMAHAQRNIFASKARQKMQYRFAAELAVQQQINGVDLVADEGTGPSVLRLPAQNNIGLSLNLLGQRDRRYFRFGLGLLGQASGFSVSDPQSGRVLYRADYTNYYMTLKLALGYTVKYWNKGSRLDLELGYNPYIHLNKETGVVLVTEPYVVNGQQYEGLKAYVDYDYGKTNADIDYPPLTILNFSPVYQSPVLFGRSALRLGLDVSYKLGAGAKFGTTNAAEVAVFKGDGDRSIIAEQRYIDRHFTLGIVLGLTF